MNLLNVRKGQFVYYQNKLHRVYSVKHFFKQSVHIIRLEDYQQQLTTAKEINLYKPEHLDSFVYNRKRYTLDCNVKANVGDYILVINPRPDSLDHYHLHAIEMVSTIETNGVISNKSNGIKHNEYWVMVPELLEGARIIDRQQPDLETPLAPMEEPPLTVEAAEPYTPRIGDVFQKNDSTPVIHAMVIAIADETVYLGGGFEVTLEDLSNPHQWSYINHVLGL